MWRRVLSIFLIGILGMFITTSCTRVGVSGFPTSSDNDGGDNQDTWSQETEYIGDSKDEDKEDKIDPDEDTDLNVEENKDNKNDDSGKTDKTGEPEPEDRPNPDTIETHYSGNGTRKLVALTFDDGPESELTPQILDILDEYDIKATFFVIGQNAARNTDVLKEIYERGHEIGNHSWSHKYLPKISKKSKEDEILKTEKLLKDILGEHAPIFRPPYGAVKAQDKQLINSLGYKIVNWSVDTRDWAGTSGEQIMKYVKQQLKPGGIILMHNSGSIKTVKNTVAVLPIMIDWIIEQGYEFTTVTEILD